MEELKPLKESLQFQFAIAWQLLDYHLTDLKEDEMLWKPAPNSLHVHKVDGKWQPDWPESEEYEMGPPSIAWTTWHILYWWSMVYDYSFGDGTLTKEEVDWPGSVQAVKEELQQFHEKWTALLETITDEELLAVDKTKWPFEERPFHELASWLNLELMKNASEIGSGRFLYASRNQKETGE